MIEHGRYQIDHLPRKNRLCPLCNSNQVDRGQEGERNNCFSNIQLVSRKDRDKTTLAS